MERIEIGEHLVSDPEICQGLLTFRGTHVPVPDVVTLIARGYSIEQILHEHPELSEPAVAELLGLVAPVLDERHPSTPEEIEALNMAMREHLAMEMMVRVGLLTEIKPRVTMPRPEHPPIQVKGKPLSEMIIEDRR